MQQRSGQVAVRVLLAINSLQVLFLYQDVDAFLSTRGRQQRVTAQPGDWVPRAVSWVLVTLMTGTLGLNLDDSWFRTSARSCWCFKTFLIFMILTIAAYERTKAVVKVWKSRAKRAGQRCGDPFTCMRSFRSSSMFL